MTPSVRAAIKNNNTGEIYQMMAESADLGMTTLEQDLKRLYMQKQDLAGKCHGYGEQQAAVPADHECCSVGIERQSEIEQNADMIHIITTENSPMAQMKGRSKTVLGLFVDGLDVKLAHLTVKGKRIIVKELKSATLVDQAAGAEGRGDGCRRRWAIPRIAFSSLREAATEDVAVESASEDNNAVLLGLLAQYPREQVFPDLQPGGTGDLLPRPGERLRPEGEEAEGPHSRGDAEHPRLPARSRRRRCHQDRRGQPALHRPRGRAQPDQLPGKRQGVHGRPDPVHLRRSTAPMSR